MKNNGTFIEKRVSQTSPLTKLNQALRPFYDKGGKRALDLIVAIPLLVLIAPLMIVLLLLVAMDGHNPLFGQARVGRGGRMFRCLKIRSMCPDAGERLAELLRTNPAAAAEWAENQKLEDDPRITRLGSFLRKTSLDELPQLWNIVRGDMSLVGPRPVLREELDRYGPYAAAYESMTPGLTGPWQVSGRNTVTYDERVQMDVRYARNHSPFGDIYLMLMTGLSVMKLTGK